MIDSFVQLEAPSPYYNRNGVSFGYVVRMVGLDRTLFLNDIGKVQKGLMLQTPMAANSRTFYLTTALMSSEHRAYECAEAFYKKHGVEYDYEYTCAGWRIKPDAWRIRPYTQSESQVMEFV